MKVYWCAHCGGGRNFGDQLTPLLLEHFGIPYEYAPGPQAQLVMVGSVLSAVPHRWRGTVLGTGFIQETMRRDLRRARILAVRGALTRRQARLPPSTPLGDMGVLAPILGDGRKVAPILELGLAHYVDGSMAQRHPNALVLPATTDVRDLIAAVKVAGIVYVSSLHGLILADALSVPHVWEKHQGVRGSGWKFRDYGTALGEDIRPGVERLSDRTSMAALVAACTARIGTLKAEAQAVA